MLEFLKNINLKGQAQKKSLWILPFLFLRFSKPVRLNDRGFVEKANQSTKQIEVRPNQSLQPEDLPQLPVLDLNTDLLVVKQIIEETVQAECGKLFSLLGVFYANYPDLKDIYMDEKLWLLYSLLEEKEFGKDWEIPTNDALFRARDIKIAGRQPLARHEDPYQENQNIINSVQDLKAAIQSFLFGSTEFGKSYPNLISKIQADIQNKLKEEYQNPDLKIIVTPDYCRRQDGQFIAFEITLIDKNRVNKYKFDFTYPKLSIQEVPLKQDLDPV